MENVLCAICQEPLRGIFKNTKMSWFCNDCYHAYHEEIMSNVAWVRVAIALERTKRRNDPYCGISNRPKEGVIIIRLGDKFDVDDGKLVIKDGYHGR